MYYYHATILPKFGNVDLFTSKTMMTLATQWLNPMAESTGQVNLTY